MEVDTIFYGLILINWIGNAIFIFQQKSIYDSIASSSLVATTTKFLSTMFIIIVVYPMTEESFFRLLLKQVFEGNSYYRLITTSLFALLHSNNGIQLSIDNPYLLFFHMYNAFVMGYIASGFDSIYHSIAFHMLCNFIQMFTVTIKYQIDKYNQPPPVSDQYDLSKLKFGEWDQKKEEIAFLKGKNIYNTHIFHHTWIYPHTNIMRLKRSYSFSDIHGDKIYRDHDLQKNVLSIYDKKIIKMRKLIDLDVDMETLSNEGEESTTATIEVDKSNQKIEEVEEESWTSEEIEDIEDVSTEIIKKVESDSSAKDTDSSYSSESTESNDLAEEDEGENEDEDEDEEEGVISDPK